MIRHPLERKHPNDDARLHRAEATAGHHQPASAWAIGHDRFSGPLGHAHAVHRYAGLQFILKVGPKPAASWNWAEFNALPQTSFTRDIHCVTKWSRFNTLWRGVLIDDILDAADLAPPTPYTLAHAFGGYTTNVPTADLIEGKAMVPPAERRRALSRGAAR